MISLVTFDHEPAGVPASVATPTLIEASVKRAGGVLVRGLPCAGNGPFLDVARALGTPVTDGMSIPSHPLEDEVVYRIEVRNAGAGVRDERELVMFSTTSQQFTCHTDGYHRQDPPDYIAMLCVLADDDGGDSLLAHVDYVVSRLEPSEIELLREPVFPTAFGFAPVLTGSASRPLIRFNLQELERFSDRADHRMTEAHWAAARRVERLAAQEAESSRLRLEPGDCIVIDNRRLLHGRTELSATSRRLLKRLWIRSAPSNGRATT